jgi:HSP20 family molecular chaperone IbpA
MSTSPRYVLATPFFEEFFGSSKGLPSSHDRIMRPTLTPMNGIASNITTTPDGTVKIEEEVPGFSKEDVTVVLKEGRLSVTLKREGRKEKRFTYHVSSKVDTTKITASCKDGILTLLLPPVTKKQVEPLTIAVS